MSKRQLAAKQQDGAAAFREPIFQDATPQLQVEVVAVLYNVRESIGYHIPVPGLWLYLHPGSSRRNLWVFWRHSANSLQYTPGWLRLAKSSQTTLERESHGPRTVGVETLAISASVLCMGRRKSKPMVSTGFDFQLSPRKREWVCRPDCILSGQ